MYVVLVVGIIALFLVLFGTRIIKKAIVNPILDKRKEQLVSMFQNTPKRPGSIIVLGDSLTEGGRWSEALPHVNILNRGIGGDTTIGVFERLEEIVRHEPTKIFLLIGTNDIAMGIPPNTIFEGIKTIIEIIQSATPHTQIYVQSLLPVNSMKPAFFTHNNKGVLAVNKYLSNYCSTTGLSYIDLHSRFVDTNGELNPRYTNDGLHLLGEGYKVWIEVLKKYL